MKSLVLERMREKGVAESDMKPSDVDLEKDYVSSESRFCLNIFRDDWNTNIFALNNLLFVCHFVVQVDLIVLSQMVCPCRYFTPEKNRQR